MGAAILTGALIFLARVTDVSMGTLRMLMLVKGRRLPAAAIGFFEVIIFTVALGSVVNSLDNIGFLLIYGFGFATGNYVGILLEERMALGHIGVQIIMSESDDLVSELRDRGFGVTIMEGWGREGPKDVATVILPRRQLPQVMEVVDAHGLKAFTIVMDARKTLGGYYHRQKSK